MAAIIPMLLNEMEQEATTTRNMLGRIPDDKYDWKPHPKSMSIRQLATHIAELPSWVSMALTTSELDFAGMDYTPTPAESTADIMAIFEKSYESGHTALAGAEEADLEPNWTLRTGDQIHSVSTKAEVIRMSFSQTVHHRAQMGVFLRLLDVAIPGSYGPSADEMKF